MTTRLHRTQFTLLGIAMVACLTMPAGTAHAEIVSFLVDPADYDNDPMDGFITGNEFNPIGSDGTVFAMTPTDNLTGADRFQLDAMEGLRFGGGGGSTLSFDFSVNQDIFLDSYTLGAGFFNLDPLFDIREGVNLLSEDNSSVSGAGSVVGFQGGPIALEASTSYSFVVTSSSAATQSYLGSFNYTTAVPEPSSLVAISIGVAAIGMRRRQRRS